MKPVPESVIKLAKGSVYAIFLHSFHKTKYYMTTLTYTVPVQYIQYSLFVLNLQTLSYFETNLLQIQTMLIADWLKILGTNSE